MLITCAIVHFLNPKYKHRFPGGGGKDLSPWLWLHFTYCTATLVAPIVLNSAAASPWLLHSQREATLLCGSQVNAPVCVFFPLLTASTSFMGADTDQCLNTGAQTAHSGLRLPLDKRAHRSTRMLVSAQQGVELRGLVLVSG